MNEVNVQHADGCASDARIRYDVAMALALKAADRHDDVTVMTLVWDAIEAAKSLRDERRLETAMYAFAGAAARWEHEHPAI